MGGENGPARAGGLTLRQVTKSYRVDGRRFDALQGITFDVAPGALVSIVGASGCGKSTLLRLIVGLDAPDHGQIVLHGKPIAGTGLDRGIVFQDHRLLPWLTLEENVGLALENVRLSRAEKRAAVAEQIALVGLEGFERAYPHQLSGGMAQRVAIARGLVSKPEILLLDEPFGALDALTRVALQEELERIWLSRSVTVLLVTHDVEEAVYLSSKVVVMHPAPGRVAQEISVDLPGVRDRAGQAFSAIRQRILTAMSTTQEAPCGEIRAVS